MRALLISLLLVGGCDGLPMVQADAQPVSQATGSAEAGRAASNDGPRFPAPDRPVAGIVSASWSDEESRDNSGEAADVIRRLGIAPGMHVADIGAGSGYYTVRLSPVVGPEGKVYANDIIPDYLNRLKRRITAEGLTNVEFTLGDAGDANLPDQSVDLALMVHMYHEISDPFGLLWNLHDDLKPGGRVAIIDADRPTSRHGTPPALLRCELEAVGFRQISFDRLGNGNYLAVYQPVSRPAPSAIKPCSAR